MCAVSTKFNTDVVQQIESLTDIELNKNVMEQLEYAGLTEP